ncbi:class I SAM-dependent methyltransferase [Geobacter pickeringii]|uniref:class I SAM-dependent methyltransferase n=1 Tax=Geobacter pickeringii TaxID=345632 RepID=UPI001184B66F|nr:class I SAM-dependent methyltransferase [Geobacter pickeringii]
MEFLCPYCRTKSSKYFSVTDLNQQLSPHSFDYYRCPSCRLIFLSPIPDDLSQYYTAAYPAYQMPTKEELKDKAEQEKYKLEILRRYAQGGRLLEVGPAYGGFAYLAKQAGFDVETIEMDRRCCEFLENVVGVKTLNCTDISEALLKVESYDVIALWHVVEHLSDPWEVLEALARKLRPGGVLIIANPSPDALQFKLFGRFWVHVDAPRHLELIPASVLAIHMERVGLKTVKITTSDKASRIFSSLGWWNVSLNHVRTDVSRVKPIRAKLLGHLMSFIIRIFLIPLERIEGLGCSYTAVFEKPRESARP